VATVVLLRHPEKPSRYRLLRLTLTGATLATSVDESSPDLQTFPSRDAAREHLDRILRLRKDEGYRILDRSETGDDVEPVIDPLAKICRLKWGQRAYLDFEQSPIEPEELVEVGVRLRAWAPALIEHIRNDDLPGGLLAQVLDGKPLPSVKSFIYGASIIGRYYKRPLDELADLLALFPNLERVEASGPFLLRELRHATLQELHLDSHSQLPAVLAKLGAGSLPALTTLGIEIDPDVDEENDLDQLAGAAILSLDAPLLRAVHVAKAEDVTDLLDVLTERPVPASWTMLYLTGSVGDEDQLLSLLRERAPALASVALLGLPVTDDLSEDGVAEVRRLLPRVIDVCELPELWPSSSTNAW